MEHQEENEAIVEPDEDGGWVDTHHHVDPSGEQTVTGAQESFAEMTLESDKVFACLSGVFLRVGLQANWEAASTILAALFDHLVERFSFKEIEFK